MTQSVCVGLPMEEVYSNLLGAYGPLTVFVALLLTGIGIPLGEDVVIIPAGILAGHGKIDLVQTAIAAYAGVLLSDFTWYWLCRKFGTPLLHKRWFKRIVHPRRLLEVKHEIEKRGVWVVVMSRFIPGSRTPAITASGVLHLPFWKFVLAESATCLVTVPLQLGLGFAVGRGLGTMETADLIISLIGVVLLILAVMLGLAWYRQRRPHRKHAPRAKAAWLRRFRPRRLGRRTAKKA